MLNTPRKPISDKKIKLIFEMSFFEKLILIRAFKIDFYIQSIITILVEEQKK